MEKLNELTNSSIFKEDLVEYNKQTPQLMGGVKINVLCSFAYLTPNYTVLFTLEELKRLVQNKNYKIFIIFWDMNALANPYFKKEISNRKIKNPEIYIDNKITELKNLAISVGLNEEDIILYKSSDLWKRLISFREQNLFQNFYSILSEINLEDFLETKKVSNTLQIPLDIFFCNYLHNLFPEDTSKPIDLVFLGNHKLKIYKIIRAKMISEGLIKIKRPLFLIIKDFPYLNYNSYVPEWNMSLEEIIEIVNNCKISKEEITSLMRNISLSTDLIINNKVMGFTNFVEYSKNSRIDDLKSCLFMNLFRYLEKCKNRYLTTAGDVQENIRNLTKLQDLKNIGNILRSDIALKILLLSDETKNTSEIAKILKKSVPTISTYANKLKKLGLIRVSKNRKLKRNLKGIKVNFDLGVENEK